MSRIEPEQVTEAAPTFNVGGGKTGWDWLSDSHPILLRILILVVVAVVVFVAWRTSPIIFGIVVITGLGSMIVGFLLFRNQFFFNDSVFLLAFDKEDYTQLSLFVIGKEKFRTLSHTGNVLSFSSESGDPVYIADWFDGQIISYPWSFETSRISFVLKADTYDHVKELAETALRDLAKVRHIPQILGMVEARDMILRHDEYLDKVLKGDDISEDIESILSEVLTEEGL